MICCSEMDTVDGKCISNTFKLKTINRCRIYSLTLIVDSQ